MKTSILLLAFAALAFGSCTSAYKTGQTPDDVYYSAPIEEGGEYVEVEKRDDRSYHNSEEYYEDRYLRYRMRSPYRWSSLDDYYYNTPYAWHYGGYNSWGYSPYNSYHCWNNYYNPYYPGVIIIKNPIAYRPPSRPIAFNPSNYSTNNNSRSSKVNAGRSNYNNNNSNRYNNSNSFGNSVRRIFSSGSNNSNGSDGRSNSSSTPSRSYNPSSSSSSSSSGRSSSSSSGGSSGGGGVSRPAR